MPFRPLGEARGSKTSLPNPGMVTTSRMLSWNLEEKLSKSRIVCNGILGEMCLGLGRSEKNAQDSWKVQKPI